MTGAREAALHTLIRCRRDGAWSGAIIDNAIKKYGLDRREAALASRICLGVLQNTALCDFYIDSFCGGRLEPKLRDILRIGVYQLVFLDRIPARAAVSETVSLCKAQGYSRAAGLANAVLRKIAEAGENLPPIPNEGTVSHLALKYSHPQWLVEYLIKRKGYAFTESFLACNNRLPGLSLQVNTLRLCSDAYSAELCKAGIEHRSYPEPDGCIVIKGGSTTELPGFDEGFFYIQDRAARIAVEVAAPECGMRVLDACAAPGGSPLPPPWP